MPIITTVVKVTAAGSAGSAAGTTTTLEIVPGFLLDIYFDFHASTPATADVTISYATRGGTIAVTSNTATDLFVAPRQKLVDNANAAITNSNEQFLLDDRVTVALAQGDALTDAVVVYIRSLVP